MNTGSRWGKSNNHRGNQKQQVEQLRPQNIHIMTNSLLCELMESQE